VSIEWAVKGCSGGHRQAVKRAIAATYCGSARGSCPAVEKIERDKQNQTRKKSTMSNRRQGKHGARVGERNCTHLDHRRNLGARQVQQRLKSDRQKQKQALNVSQRNEEHNTERALRVRVGRALTSM